MLADNSSQTGRLAWTPNSGGRVQALWSLQTHETKAFGAVLRTLLLRRGTAAIKLKATAVRGFRSRKHNG